MDLSKRERKSKMRYLTVVCVALSYVNLGVQLSQTSTLYPVEAEKNGVTQSEIGISLSMLDLGSVCFALLVGRFGHYIKAKTLCVAGLFLVGVCLVFTGMLDLLRDQSTAFFGLACLVRFTQGASSATSMAAIYSVLMELFPTLARSIPGYTQVFYAVGFVIGPILGTKLYESYGFGAPYYLVGGIQIVISLSGICLIPHVDSHVDDNAIYHQEEGDERHTLFNAMKSPILLAALVDSFLSRCGGGMFEANLSLHLLGEVGATQEQVALTFSLLGLGFLLSNPIMSFVNHHISEPLTLSILSNVFMATSFLLVGPVPFLPLKPSMPIIYVMAVLYSLGFACGVVSTFSRAYHTLVDHLGYKNNINTYLMLSGIWLTFFDLGRFVGPATSGFLVESAGFPNATIAYFVAYAIMAAADIFQLWYFREQNKREYHQIY